MLQTHKLVYVICIFFEIPILLSYKQGNPYRKNSEWDTTYVDVHRYFKFSGVFPGSQIILDSSAGLCSIVIYIYVEFGVVVIKLRSTRGSNCSSRAELARLESCNYCLKCWVIWLLLPQTPRICITSTVSLVAKIIVICVT